MLADYNIQIQHRPGTQNRADPLSRRPDYDDGKEDNKEVTLLPMMIFNTALRSTSLQQTQERAQLEAMKEEHGLEFNAGVWENKAN